jgi:hypothetical protein
MTQWNDLMNHQTSDIGRFAESGIANHIEIREARNSKRSPDSVPARFLNVAEQLGRAAEAESRK